MIKKYNEQDLDSLSMMHSRDAKLKNSSASQYTIIRVHIQIV